MTTLAIIGATWLAASIPIGIVFGRTAALAADHIEYPHRTRPAHDTKEA